jgi:phage gp29-like protein
VIKRDIPVVLLTSWTPDMMQLALDQHMNGHFAQSAFLCDAIIGDDRVAATLGQRMGALFSRPMKTTAAKKDTSGEVAAAWDEAWDRFAPTSVLEELQTWGNLLGVWLAEIQWDTSVTPWQPTLKPWHPTHLSYRWDLRKYMVTTMDGVEIIEPGDGRWVLGTPHGPYRGWRRGAVRPCATPWWSRQLSWRDHARFNERHGLPIIVAKSPARTDPKLRDGWIQGLSTMGQEAVVSCPQMIDGSGYDVSILEAKDRAWESFGAVAARADMAIVLSLLWQNLTTEVTGGSYAAAVVHEGVKQTAARFDNQSLTQTIHQQCARPYAAWNYGDPDLAPTRTWVIEEPADHLTSSQTFGAFAKALSDMKAGGFQLTTDAVAALAFSFNLPLNASQISIVAASVAAGEAPAFP